MYQDVHEVKKDYKNEKVITTAESAQAIKNSLRNILTVRRGSLPGDPNFGSELFNIIFGQIDGLTLKLQDSFVREAIKKYEPRVRLQNVQITEVPEFNRIVLKLEFLYLDKETGEVLDDSLSVPFDLL